MQRTTKLMAAMLVLTCAMTLVPQKAEASLYGVLLTLLQEGSENYVPPDTDVRIWNDTGREIKLQIWDSNGGYDYVHVPAGRAMDLRSRSRTTTYAVRLSVLNNGRWVAKDYEYFGHGARVSAYKHRRGDFRFSAWYLR